jgi:2-methylcitrate dehydratase PrpD
MKRENNNLYLNSLASFIVDFKNTQLDESSFDHVAMLVADTYATAFSGIKSMAFKTAFYSAEKLFGKGNFQIWGSNKKSSLLGSVFYNTLAISSTDYDEGHRKAVGHPASALVAPALVLGSDLKLSLREILKSVIIGYEIATRFSLARDPHKINSYSSGRWAALGTATTVSYLLNLNITKTMHALSNASVLSPHMLGGSTDVSTGSMSKEGVAWAVQSGLQSAMFANDGFSGPYLFLEDHDEFINDLLIKSLGESWYINSNYFKPYACCRWLHPALKCCSEIINSHKINISEIENIKVFAFSRLKDLISKKHPDNVIMAQFHLPYAIAVILLYNECGPVYFSDDFLRNSEIKKIIDKVEIIEDEKYTAIFPSELASRIEIKTKAALFEYEVLTAPWEYGQHPSKEELKQKFGMQTINTKHIDWNWFFDY